MIGKLVVEKCGPFVGREICLVMGDVPAIGVAERLTMWSWVSNGRGPCEPVVVVRDHIGEDS